MPFVAQPDGANATRLGHAAAECGHWIGIVKQPGARAQLLHLLCQFGNDWNIPQGARQPPGTDRVAHRLVDAVFLGNLEVMTHGLQPAGCDGENDEIGSAERIV